MANKVKYNLGCNSAIIALECFIYLWKWHNLEISQKKALLIKKKSLKCCLYLLKISL